MFRESWAKQLLSFWDTRATSSSVRLLAKDWIAASSSGGGSLSLQVLRPWTPSCKTERAKVTRLSENVSVASHPDTTCQKLASIFSVLLYVMYSDGAERYGRNTHYTGGRYTAIWLYSNLCAVIRDLPRLATKRRWPPYPGDRRGRFHCTSSLMLSLLDL